MKLICINCPRGCHLEVEMINGEVQVSGNSCPRGVTYARNEMLNPMRTLTTTVEIEAENGRRLPVISSSPLPKDRIMEAMKALKETSVKAPVRLGDIIVENILGLDVNIIASKSIEK